MVRDVAVSVLTAIAWADALFVDARLLRCTLAVRSAASLRYLDGIARHLRISVVAWRTPTDAAMVLSVTEGAVAARVPETAWVHALFVLASSVVGTIIVLVALSYRWLTV